MSDESANPSCISHLSIGTNDFPRARAFYDTVMAALGCKVILEYPGACRQSRNQADEKKGANKSEVHQIALWQKKRPQRYAAA